MVVIILPRTPKGLDSPFLFLYNKRMKTGFTCSTFDLFHAGHIIMLEEAKKQCDYLIVGLQTDPTIDRPEKNKPVQGIFERYVQLRACRYVNEIVVYATEKELLDVLQSYPIDVRILGDEYASKPFTGDNLDMELYFNRREHSFSTTELRQRVVDAERIKNGNTT
jgi:glycerol-3-phosphate cytidylyltransferase